MKPRVPLTDPRFVYARAVATDIRKTFERVRAEQAAEKTNAPVRIDMARSMKKGKR